MMYGVRKDGDWYCIEKGSDLLTTPMGKPVRTLYKPLADKLVCDLEEYGESPKDPVSICAFHYAMIDFFATMPRGELEHSVAIGLDPENDWTFNCPTAMPEPMMNWIATFGTSSSNTARGKDWLSTLSLMQLCAVCVIGRALESVNIPFIVATMLDRKHITKYAKEVDKYYPYVGLKDLVRYLENFLYYFSLENTSHAQDEKPTKGSSGRG